MVQAAAFGRLCVETPAPAPGATSATAAAFGRLCVETWVFDQLMGLVVAAAFGRLCVETPAARASTRAASAAAFGRLCVETSSIWAAHASRMGSRLRAAVC